MALADFYRNRFLAQKGFSIDPWEGLNTLNEEAFSKLYGPQPQTMNQYMMFREESKQQNKGSKLARSPLKYKFGRRNAT